MRFFHVQPSELAELDEFDRHSLGREMVRISARERFVTITDLGALLTTGEERRDYMLKLAGAAFSGEPEILARLFEAYSRKA